MSSPAPEQDKYIAEFRAAAHELVDWIAGFLSDPRQYPVVAQVKPGALTDALPASAPQQGESYPAMLRDFERLVLPAVTHWNHPGFLAYFPTSGSAPAVLAEMLAAAINTNGLHWKTSPALVELEQVTLGWLAEWVGVPREWFGIVYDTASLSSLHAIAAAREMVAPEARENGAPAGLTVYTSEQAHSSIEKACIALGIGQKSVRKIATDGEFRMRPDALRAAIEQDLRDHKRPMCVVATVGTTSTTSVDPVAEIAAIVRQHDLWLHVDAAYAGTAAILPEFRHILKGIERADSLVVNPHKWMLVPVDLSAFYTRHPEILRRAFSLVPEYLRTQEDPRAVNLMDYSLSLGRRFRALKLWFVMRYFGREGIERMLRAHIAMAQRLAAMVDQGPQFERVAPAPFSVVCFRYKGTDDENRAILEKVNASGKAYISHTSLKGQVVLRIAVGNLGTTWEDVQQAWELVRAAANTYHRDTEAQR
jgi:aromatic-L-amino-acid decarboxylase